MEEILTTEFLKPERLLRATVRVWDGRPDKGGTFIGTAFFVSPTEALTAAHIFRGMATDTLMLHLSWRGGFYARVQNIRFASEPTDAAILEIGVEAAAPADSIVTAGDAIPLTIGTPLQIVGFADTISTAEIRPATVTGLDAQANANIIDPPPAKGMSGGPALSPDGLLRGMIWARDLDKGRGYLTPLSSLRPLLATVAKSDAVPTRMIEYPALSEDRKQLAHTRTLLLEWRALYSDKQATLAAAAKQARAFQRRKRVPSQAEALDLAELVQSVCDAVDRLPVHELEPATHYGLRIHHAVVIGFAPAIVEPVFRHLQHGGQVENDEYAYEMMARILESAIAMLEFRPDRLPLGFGDPTVDMQATAIEQATSLMLGRARHSDELFIISTSPKVEAIGSLVARPRDLKVDAARRMADGTIEVLATDFQYDYRWSMNRPRPIAQYRHESALCAGFPASTPGSSPLFVGNDGRVRELYLDGSCNELAEAEKADSWIASAVWTDTEESDTVYLLNLSKDGKMRSTRLGSAAAPVERSFDEACLDPEASDISWTLSRYQTRIGMLDVEGFPCALVLTRLPTCWPVLFIDPKRLQPIRPMLRLRGKIMDCTVAAGRWLVISHYGVHQDERLLAIYDLLERRDLPVGELRNRGEDSADIIDLSSRTTGRDACELYFVRNSLYPVNGYRLCRWSWPENRLEEFPEIDVENLFPVQI